jgi:hypothetical protein
MTAGAYEIIAWAGVVVGLIVLLIWLYERRANRVVADERDEFDDYVWENPETRFRKVNGEDHQ